MSYFTVGTGNGAKETSVRIRMAAAAGIAAVALGAAACGSSPSGGNGTSSGGSAPAAGSAGSSAALKTANISGVTVVTNGRGFTLYSFAPDTTTKSECKSACAQIWPPVTGPVKAGQGVSGKLGTITRPDGSTQVTYDGHPLYSYTVDTAPGQAKGNGLNVFGGVWHEVTADGSAPPAGSSGGSGGGNAY